MRTNFKGKPVTSKSPKSNSAKSAYSQKHRNNSKAGTTSKPEPVKPVTIAVSETTIEEHPRSIYIRFHEKPSPEDRDILKASSWRYSRRGFWYHRKTDENLKFAMRIQSEGFGSGGENE
jgi:hypothetical protein